MRKWLQVDTLEDFKKLGSYRNLRKEIESTLGDKLYFKARGWIDLWTVVQNIHKLYDLAELKVQTSNPENISDTTLMYFKSEADRIIYALIELDEGYRLKELGVDRSHYRDSNQAKQWRNNLAKMIHPDLCDHPKANLAINKLTEIFENMIGE